MRLWRVPICATPGGNSSDGTLAPAADDGLPAAAAARRSTSPAPDHVQRPVRVYFLGSGSLAIPVLKALHGSARIELVGVGTQPDRPSGRHRHLHGTPLSDAAEELGLHPNKPDRVNAEEFLNHLRKLTPEMIVVVAFGQLLKRSLLELPPLGCLNVHASILPNYRGASPIQAAILAGDEATGVSFMRMDEGLDSGPVYQTLAVPIDDLDTAESLTGKLARVAGDHVVDILVAVADGRLLAQPQMDELATYARKIKKSQGAIRWPEAAEAVARQVRAFVPWPHAHFFVDGGRTRKRIQITAAKAVASPSHGFMPGEIVQADKHGWTVACGIGFLHIYTVVPEGRPEMTSEAFLRGARIGVGTVLADGDDG